MKPNSSEEINALLGEGTEFEGQLNFEGTVRVDGKFTGEIRGKGTLIIGEKGVVKAEVETGVVLVKGEAHGTIRAKDRIEAYSPAKIFAHLHSPVLVFGEGVVFQGTSRMAEEAEQGGEVRTPGPEGASQ
jgi:cytoskeletal protein CcmA (bactofilin family)